MPAVTTLCPPNVDSVHIEFLKEIMKQIEEKLSTVTSTLKNFNLIDDRSKICVLSLSTSFVNDMQSIIYLLQKTTLQSKKTYNNEPAKVFVKTVGHLLFLIQQKLNSDIEELKLQVIAVLENILPEIKSLQVVVTEESLHDSKHTITMLLDNVLSAIGKFELRFNLQNLDEAELEKLIYDFNDKKLQAISSIRSKHPVAVKNLVRASQRGIERIYEIVARLDFEADVYDDDHRKIILNVSEIMAKHVMELESYIRTKESLDDILGALIICSRNVHLPVKYITLLVYNNYKNQQLSNNLHDLALSTIVNTISCSRECVAWIENAVNVKILQ